MEEKRGRLSNGGAVFRKLRSFCRIRLKSSVVEIFLVVHLRVVFFFLFVIAILITNTRSLIIAMRVKTHLSTQYQEKCHAIPNCHFSLPLLVWWKAHGGSRRKHLEHKRCASWRRHRPQEEYQSAHRYVNATGRGYRR